MADLVRQALGTAAAPAFGDGRGMNTGTRGVTNASNSCHLNVNLQLMARRIYNDDALWQAVWRQRPTIRRGTGIQYADDAPAVERLLATFLAYVRDLPTPWPGRSPLSGADMARAYDEYAVFYGNPSNIGSSREQSVDVATRNTFSRLLQASTLAYDMAEHEVAVNVVPWFVEGDPLGPRTEGAVELAYELYAFHARHRRWPNSIRLEPTALSVPVLTPPRDLTVADGAVAYRLGGLMVSTAAPPLRNVLEGLRRGFQSGEVQPAMADSQAHETCGHYIVYLLDYDGVWRLYDDDTVTDATAAVTKLLSADPTGKSPRAKLVRLYEGLVADTAELRGELRAAGERLLAAYCAAHAARALLTQAEAAPLIQAKRGADRFPVATVNETAADLCRNRTYRGYAGMADDRRVARYRAMADYVEAARSGLGGGPPPPSRAPDEHGDTKSKSTCDAVLTQLTNFDAGTNDYVPHWRGTPVEPPSLTAYRAALTAYVDVKERLAALVDDALSRGTTMRNYDTHRVVSFVYLKVQN
jgi:hypothetical protein